MVQFEPDHKKESKFSFICSQILCFCAGLDPVYHLSTFKIVAVWFQNPEEQTENIEMELPNARRKRATYTVEKIHENFEDLKASGDIGLLFRGLVVFFF